MKKITIKFLLMFAIISIQAQNYYIDFTASGTATTLDSVFVENLTQGTSLTLPGNDTLHLYGFAGINSNKDNITELKVYPNPFTERCNIEFYSEAPTFVAIDVYDIVGKHILHLRQEIEKGTNVFEVSGFSTGHYKLIISTETWQKASSFVSLNNDNINPKIELKSTLINQKQVKSTFKSIMNTIGMPYTDGNQIRFTGYSGALSVIVNDVPTSSKTIDFVFAVFSCGDSVTFTYNGSLVTYGTVISSGQCWLDRNLGASQVATSSTDANAYGYLYQWGRAADGHQIRTSGTTTALSSSDTPGHGEYIITYSIPSEDWRSPENSNLWQGVNGINNPCPLGWRLPTEAEWDAERQSWGINNTAGAFASPLKLSMAGHRRQINSIYDVGGGGYYWSSTVSSTWSRYLYFDSINANMSSFLRACGLSVRCLKDN